MLSRLDADFRIAVDAARAVNQRQAKEFTIGHCACTSPQFRRQIRVVQKVRYPQTSYAIPNFVRLGYVRRA